MPPSVLQPITRSLFRPSPIPVVVVQARGAAADPLRVGMPAPDFELEDQFARKVMLSKQRGKRNVMLAFYPLDWTPTCTREIPTIERMLEQFLGEANTLPMAISVDQRFSHARWAQSLGGIRYPLLSDFWPHGEVAARYGALIRSEGVADRTLVIVDRNGIIRHVSRTPKDGERDWDAMFAEARRISARDPVALRPAGAVAPRPLRAKLYVNGECGFCHQAVAIAINLKARDVEVATLKGYGPDMDEARELSGRANPYVPMLVLWWPDGSVEKVAGIDAVRPKLVEVYGHVGL